LSGHRCGFNFPAGQTIRGAGIYSATVSDQQDASIEYFFGTGWEGSSGSWFVYYRTCIDLCASIGLNAIKVQANITSYIRGTSSVNQLYAHWEQLIRYATKMGLSVLVNIVLDYDLGFCNPSSAIPTTAQVEGFFHGWLAWLAATPDNLLQNVTHIDYFNECMPGNNPSLGITFYNNAVPDSNLPSNVPVANSCSSVPLATSVTTMSGSSVTSANDVIDVHFYEQNYNYPAPSDYDSTYGTSLPTWQLVVGEYGSPNGGATNRVAQVASMMAFANSRPGQIRGVFHWTVWDRGNQGIWQTTSAITYNGNIDLAGLPSGLTYPLTPDAWPPTRAINSSWNVIPALQSDGPSVSTPNAPSGMRVSNESKQMVWNGAYSTNNFATTNLYRVTGAGNTTKILSGSYNCMIDDSVTWTKTHCGYQATVVDGNSHEGAMSGMYVPTRLPRRQLRHRLRAGLH